MTWFRSVRKILWGGLSVLSTIWVLHYAKVAEYYQSIYPNMRDALYFSECWLNVSLIILIISLIMLMRD